MRLILPEHLLEQALKYLSCLYASKMSIAKARSLARWPDEVQGSVPLSLISISFQNRLVTSMLITGKVIWPGQLQDCLGLTKTVPETMHKIQLYGQLRPLLVISVDVVKRVLFACKSSGATALSANTGQARSNFTPSVRIKGSDSGHLEAKRDQD